MPKTLILVVEDDPDIMQLLTYNLQAASFEVVSATDGNNALTLARQYVPHLVILDLMIPGINGFEVCKELKRGRIRRRFPL